MENKVELYKAIAAVMSEVKGIDKSTTVGEGKNAFKAVSDKDVKKVIGDSMTKHGLICLPKSYETSIKVERWEEVDPWSNTTPKAMKTKQSVFVEASCVFTFIHVETGQSVDIPAYGHGVDPLDKAAGKATTYALKYALLYSFLVPTGSIDDSDKAHSNEQPIPQPKAVDNKLKPTEKKSVKDFDAMKKAVSEDPKLLTTIVAQYELTAAQLDDLQILISK